MNKIKTPLIIYIHVPAGEREGVVDVLHVAGESNLSLVLQRGSVMVYEYFPKSNRVISQRDNSPYILFSGFGPKRIKKQVNRADLIPNMI